MKKISILLLITIFCFSCTSVAFASEPASETEAQYTEMVNEAIEVLAERWNENYWESEYPDKEYLLDIRSTRVVCIRDRFDEEQNDTIAGVREELFGEVQYIIEFLLYTDTFSIGEIASGQNVGYYPNSMTDDNVIVYKDGSMECVSEYLQKYRARTFTVDFSTMIDQVIDLHEEFNQVIRFQNHKIFFEDARK